MNNRRRKYVVALFSLLALLTSASKAADLPIQASGYDYMKAGQPHAESMAASLWSFKNCRAMACIGLLG